MKENYRPEWLEGLELATYVPVKKLAFEYRGLDHFQMSEHWSDQRHLEKKREKDQKKA